MVTKNDARREVGSIVKAKASVVTSVAECKRLYGMLWKTTLVTGVVMRVVTPPKGTGKHTSVVAEWTVGSFKKVKEVKLVNVKLHQNVCHAKVPAEVPPLVTESNNETASGDTNQGTQEQISVPSIPERTTMPRHDVHQAEERITVHGVEWMERDVRLPLNGIVPRRYWSVTHVTGSRIAENQGATGLTPYDYFSWMFPMSHLRTIVDQTNLNLARHAKQVTSPSEILKFFGVLVLMTRYEYGDRRNLWSTTSSSKYVTAPNFTRIMPRHRFESLRQCIRFSVCPLSDTEDTNRWNLVDDFVTAINEHRQMFVTPSDYICVDESMSRWYGLGGDWIDVGLPSYRAIDRKPENGCEIKTSACGRSGIMLRLEIVKSPLDDAPRDDLDGLNHGTAVVLRLISPWLYTNRIVCADSYFASWMTAKALRDKDMRFIGVVKTASKGYPMRYLSSKPMSGRGEWYSMVSKGDMEGHDICAVLWVDRERRYFVTTAGTTLPGQTIYRERWRRFGNTSKKIITETSIPQVAETYYATASQVDRHNRCRQDELNLEKKFEVKEWSLRVNTSLLAICIVDAWLLYKGNRAGRESMSPNCFYTKLSEQLIDNTYSVTSTRSMFPEEEVTDVTASGIGPHLTPSHRKRHRKDGVITKSTYQGRCRVCKTGKKSKYVCSECTRTKLVDHWICHSSTGRKCFSEHLKTHHCQD